MRMKIIPEIFLFYIIFCFGINSLNGELDDCSVCGKGPTNFPRKPLVADGNEIPNTESFPWLVRIDIGHDEVHCAGSILDEYFILTAAHCLEPIYKAGLEYQYRMKILLQTESKKWFEEAGDIEALELHPKYRLIKSNITGLYFPQYDIGLIKLKEKIKCNKYRRSICLPKADYKVPTNKELHIAGWGIQRSSFHVKGVELTKKLHYGVLKRIRFGRCMKSFPEIIRVKDHILCIGNTEQTVCPGDSGSPLIDKINGKYMVLGVASSETKLERCKAANPVLYINVAQFVKWIKKTKKKLLKKSYYLIENLKGKCSRKRCKARNYNKRC